MKTNQQSDKFLHHQFLKLGNHRRLLTNELLALLPEIYERGIYKKYASSIVKYAAKFGGLIEAVVVKRLRLEKYVKNMPKLKEAIKTEGMHKVALVASLATAENEAALVDKIKNMSKPALQELSKELRARQEPKNAPDYTGNQSLFEDSDENHIEAKSSFCQATPTKITIELDEEMSFIFLKLKKQLGDKLSNMEVMKKILEMADGQKVVKSSCKNSISNLLKPGQSETLTDQKLIPGDRDERSESPEKIFSNPKRPYIKVSLRREKLAETRGKCAYPGCNKPAENFHHTKPLSEGGRHESIIPLCKTHHEFMHNGLVENQQMEATNWQLSLAGELTYADYWYRHYRKS